MMSPIPPPSPRSSVASAAYQTYRRTVARNPWIRRRPRPRLRTYLPETDTAAIPDTDLAALVSAWPTLPAPIRLAVMALVAAAGPPQP